MPWALARKSALARTSFGGLLDLLGTTLDWPLLHASCAFWSPETHTFFLGYCEMTILVEDVHGLLGVTQIGASRPDIDFPLLYGTADMKMFMDHIFTAPPTFLVIKGHQLNLVQLYYSFRRIEDSTSKDQLWTCLHLLTPGPSLTESE